MVLIVAQAGCSFKSQSVKLDVEILNAQRQNSCPSYYALFGRYPAISN